MIGLVGDDVVDLDDPSIARAHPRFAERVCSEDERARVATSPDLLWTLFAAKEAAYKIAAKQALGPPPVFAHRAFVVAPDLGVVRWEGRTFALRIEHGEGFVHAVATHGPGHVVTAVEPIAQGGDASRCARELAVRRLSPRIGSELTVVRDPRPGSWDGFGPPRLLSRGAPSGVDVSLSHDGRFVSFAASIAGHSTCLGNA